MLVSGRPSSSMITRKGQSWHSTTWTTCLTTWTMFSSSCVQSEHSVQADSLTTPWLCHSHGNHNTLSGCFRDRFSFGPSLAQPEQSLTRSLSDRGGTEHC